MTEYESLSASWKRSHQVGKGDPRVHSDTDALRAYAIPRSDSATFFSAKANEGKGVRGRNNDISTPRAWLYAECLEYGPVVFMGAISRNIKSIDKIII